MNKKQIDRLMKLWFNLSALIVLVGAIFKLQHYPHGQLILMIGLASWFISLGVKTMFAKSKKKTVNVD